MMNTQDYPWFYAPELPMKGRAALDAEETRHMKAQRLKPESKVSLFNGKGLVGIGTMSADGAVQLLEVHEAPKSEFSLAIAAAVPKGDRADWMLQKLTELGVSTIIPLKTERSVVLPRDAKQERWHRILIEACKQSKQALVPELRALSTIEEALGQQADIKLILDQKGKPILDIIKDNPKTILGLIGPEGDFTDEEKTMLEKAGCVKASLGKQVLRVETAAIALAATHNLFK